MACSCTKSSTATADKKYTVLKSDGSKYKTYKTRLEADAAARRVGGTVVPA